MQSLRSFLRLTSWYAKFIPNNASVVEPLRELLWGPSTFSWSVKAQQSLDSVQALIVSRPALALLDTELYTIVTTDASDYGLGAVLTQIHADKMEKTIAFVSRTLTESEENIPQGKRKSLDACG